MELYIYIYMCVCVYGFILYMYITTDFKYNTIIGIILT